MSIIMAVFGVFWMIFTSSMGAPGFFSLFGLLFIIIAIVQAIYHFTNAAGRNRMSLFDITDHDREPDPLQQYFHGSEAPTASSTSAQPSGIDPREVNFCPYCGRRIADASHRFCMGCGKEILSRS